MKDSAAVQISTRSRRGLVFTIACAASWGCSGDESLSAGDSLVIALTPDDPYVTPHIATDVTGGSCAAGSSLVTLFARGADGSLAAGGSVQLWLDPALDATLVDGSVNIENGSGTTCLAPGMDAGSITIHAQSGLVSATKTITVRNRFLPDGSKLNVIMDKSNVSKATSIDNQTCVLSSALCAAAQPRWATVLFAVDSAGAKQPPPTTVGLVVAVTAGWLTRQACNASDALQAGNSSIDLVLNDGQHGAVNWCLKTETVDATITAWSGSISTSASLTAPGAPANMILQVHGGPTTNGKRTVTLAAIVQDCSGAPLSGRSLAFSVQSGAFDSGTTPMVGTTDAAGMATVVGLADAGTLEVLASIAGQAGPTCQKTLGAE